MARRLNISLEKGCDCDKASAAAYDQGNGQDNVFMMTGPMGDMYTKALAVKFAKEPLGEESTSNADPEVATESQSQDAMLASAAAAQAHIEQQHDHLQHIRLVTAATNLVSTPQVIAYVVHAKDSLNPETVVKVNDWVEKAKAGKRGVIMICDTGKANQNWMKTNANVVDDGKILSSSEIGQSFTRATEAYYEKMGVPVIFGMENFVDYLGKNYGSKEYKAIATEGFLENVKRFFTGNKKESLFDNRGGDINYIKGTLKKQYVNQAWLDKQQFGEGGGNNEIYIKELDKLENLMRWLTDFSTEYNDACEKNIAKASKASGKLTAKDLIDLTTIWNKWANKTPIEYRTGFKLKYEKSITAFRTEDGPEEDGDPGRLDVVPLSRQEAKILATKLVAILDKEYLTNPWFGVDTYSDNEDTISRSTLAAIEDETGKCYYESVDSVWDSFEKSFLGHDGINELLYEYFRWLDKSVLGIAKKRDNDGDHEYR